MNAIIYYTQRTLIGEMPQDTLAKNFESCLSLAENRILIKANGKTRILNNCTLIGVEDIKEVRECKNDN